MTESDKKQLLIIGNGFDLACGLKSSYASFFNERYKDLIKKIKKDDLLRKAYDKTKSATGIYYHGESYHRDRKYRLDNLNQYYNEKKFNFWDLVFFSDYLINNNDINKKKWADIEQMISHIAKLFTDSAKRTSYDKYILEHAFQRNYELNDMFNELKKLEKEFKDYLEKQLKGQSKYNYQHLQAKLFESLISNFTSVNILSFNYTPDLTKIPWELGIYKNTNIVNYKNIHGDIYNDIIFGIDSLNVSPDGELYRFTKTYRIIANNLNNNYIDILDDFVDIITFYGHSLAEADFSYFESIFDYYNIYSSKVILEFYCVLYKEKNEITENNKLRRENYRAICKLLYKYGESIGGMRGKNLIHKLLLENRLKIRYEYTRYVK